MGIPGSQGLKPTNFPNLRSNQERALDPPVTKISLFYLLQKRQCPLQFSQAQAVNAARFPVSSELISDHDHSLPPGRTAPSGCSCFQQEPDDSRALTFPDWSGDTNSHSQGWESVRKLSRWKPVQPKGNHIMHYDGIGNFIKNKISKQKEQQWKEKLQAILQQE